MEYTINFLTEKQVNGQRMYECSLEDANGVVTEKVSIWQFDKSGVGFPGFDGLMTGHKVAGNLWKSQKGYFTLFAPKENALPEGQNGVLRPSEAQKQGLSGSDKKTRLMRIITEIQNLSEEANSLLR